MKKKKNGSSPVTLDGSSKSASKKKKPEKNSEKWIEISEEHIKQGVTWYLAALRMIDAKETISDLKVGDNKKYYVRLEVSK